MDHRADKETIRSEYTRSFIPAQQNNTGTSKTFSQTLNHNLIGNDIKKFYESVINDNTIEHNSSNDNIKSRESSLQNNTEYDVIEIDSTTSIKEEIIMNSKKQIRSVRFDYRKWVNNLLTLSATGDIKELKLLVNSVRNEDNFKDLLNSIDTYGWTALMCAAAEGHLKVVRYLIEHGCVYNDVYESSGKDLIAICKQKQQNEILHYISCLEKSKKKAKIKSNENVTKFREEKVVCELCGEEYLGSKQKQHEASTLHIFKDVNKITTNSLYIPGSNVGFQMMLRSGWSADKGLGPEGAGRKNPIKTILKQDRAGLGLVDNAKKKISHFDAFDDTAVKRNKKFLETKRVQKKFSKKTYEKKIKKDKDWERNMRHHMSHDF